MKSKVARKAQLEIHNSKSEITKPEGLKYPYAVQSNAGILAVQGQQPRVDVWRQRFPVTIWDNALGLHCENINYDNW